MMGQNRFGDAHEEFLPIVSETKLTAKLDKVSNTTATKIEKLEKELSFEKEEMGSNEAHMKAAHASRQVVKKSSDLLSPLSSYR